MIRSGRLVGSAGDALKAARRDDHDQSVGPFVQRVELNARFVMNLNLSDNDLEQIAGADRRGIDPPI